MNPLYQFFLNKDMSIAVKNYLFAFADELALKKLKNGEDASGYADAVDTITKAFSNLEEEYGKTKKSTGHSSR